MNNIVVVGIGELNVAVSPVKLSSLGLGSCVGIVLYDSLKKIGGLAHIMLPDSSQVSNNLNRGKFANTAAEDLVIEMIRIGARKEMMVAKLAGGAHMFGIESDVMKIGQRNIAASREALKKLGIPIVAEEVGGSVGRTIELSTETGILRIKTANKIIKEI